MRCGLWCWKAGFKAHKVKLTLRLLVCLHRPYHQSSFILEYHLHAHFWYCMCTFLGEEPCGLTHFEISVQTNEDTTQSTWCSCSFLDASEVSEALWQSWGESYSGTMQQPHMEDIVGNYSTVVTYTYTRYAICTQHKPQRASWSKSRREVNKCWQTRVRVKTCCCLFASSPI